MVCFPHAGAGANVFRAWSGLVPPAVELCAVRYPGREDRLRDPPPVLLVDLADEIAEAVRLVADRPLLLLGHSMGAVLAHEVAVRLEASGVDLRGLVLSGREGPRHAAPSGLHLLPDEELLAHVGAEGDLAYRDSELRALLLPVLRDDCRLLNTHQWTLPPARVKAPVLVCAGEDDPRCRVVEAESWSEVAGNDFQLKIFPGDHLFAYDRAGEVVSFIFGAQAWDVLNS